MLSFGKNKIKSNMKERILKFWPVVFIFSIWFIFASPYFIKGLVPFPSEYLVNFFAPWASYQEFAGPVKNNAMPDIITQIYPWKNLTIESLKNGIIPLWNPYSFSGSPHLANYQSAVFSPFNLLFFIFPFRNAWSLSILLQPLLAGIFTYLLIRSFKVKKLGAVISSITFMFCGFIVVWMAYGTLAFSIIYLPLSLFAIQKFKNEQKLRYLFLLSITVPLSFFSGHFQISLYFFLATCAFALYQSFREKLLTRLCLLGSIILGFIFCLPQLLPSLELYGNSVRSATFILTEAIPVSYLITAIAPDFLGNAVTRNDWYGHYAEWASFVGIISLVLAFIALLKIKKEILFFGILGAFALLVSLNTPIALLIVSLKIPVISTSALSRIIVLFSFSIAVLAGFGMDTLSNLIKARRIKPVLVISGFISIFMVMLWVAIYLFPFLSADKLVIAKRNLIIPTAILLLGIFCIVLAFRFKKFSFYFLIGLLFLTSLDSLRFAQKWMPFDPPDLVYPNIPVISAMQRETNGIGRVAGNIGGEVAVYYRIQSMEGYDPLYIDRYGQFLRSTGGEFVQAERSVAKLGRRGESINRAFDLMGSNIFFHPVADTNQSWAYPVWEDRNRHTLIYKDDKFQLFRNNNALERVRLFYNYEVIKDDRKIINRFYSNDFNFKDSLILEEDPKLVKIDERPKGYAKILFYENNKIEIESQTEKPALLFLSDNYYPGWKAYIDDSLVKILRADYTFRAVVVPSGKHKVEFRYQPDSLRYGLYAFGGGIITLVLLGFVLRKRYLF